MKSLSALRDLLVPPLCLACGHLVRHRGDRLCPPCDRRLAGVKPIHGAGPQGVDRSWSAAAHEGVARDLVIALKQRRLTPAALEMAGRIDGSLPAVFRGGVVTPVPTAPLRTLARGFDPAACLAAALAQRMESTCATGTLVRVDGGRQVGRRRAERLGRSLDVRCRRAPDSVLLVDDVMTTGATISACARALREAGALRIVAVTFSRRL